MSQIGYGNQDTVGSPFSVIAAVASQAIQAINGRLVLNNGTGVTGVAITLPQSPPDGAVFELMSTVATNTGTIAAGTGDTVGGTALTSFTANTTFRWAYSLSGNAAGTGARTWFRLS